MNFILLTVLALNLVGCVRPDSDEEILANIQDLVHHVTELKRENQELRNYYEAKLFDLEVQCSGSKDNETIDERVTLLEAQMLVVQEDMNDAQDDVNDVEDDINFLFDDVSTLMDGQVLQDQRILALEQESDGLDDRVEILEDAQGAGENVTALELRIDALELTTSEHDNTIIVAEADIQGLQVTDVLYETRITDLEENVGDGQSSNETIAFRAHFDLGDNDNIQVGSIIRFSEVNLNEGDGYRTSGVFTVPPGGDGFYYFASTFTVNYGDEAAIDLQVNGEVVCTMYDEAGYGHHNSGCNAVVLLSEGDDVRNFFREGDENPLVETSGGYYNLFTGFRIAPSP